MQESDAAIERLKKQLDNLISEKELITTQITRKCEEIELLNQKINMMQMALDRSTVNRKLRFDQLLISDCRQQPVQRPTRGHKTSENRNKKSKIAEEFAGSRQRQYGRYATRSLAIEPRSRSGACPSESFGERDDDADECSQVVNVTLTFLMMLIFFLLLIN